MELGRYQLVERLAIGGMAEIYRATIQGALDFHKAVVIKRILPHLAEDEEFVSMFIDEAKLTAQLMHPKIAQVIELGMQDGQLFIAMEYVEGIDVLDLLQSFSLRDKRIPPEIAVHIMHEVTDALDFAHTTRNEDGQPLGIVHRDISPGNILLSKRGSVKLTDFGIARAATIHKNTNDGALKGKYSYMSPEQVVGADLDARSDLFACGVVLVEMLIGRRLFDARHDMEILTMARDVDLVRYHEHRDEIHRELRWIIERALRRDPRNRFPDARTFREALADWLFRQRLRVSAEDVATLVQEIHESKQKQPRPADPGAALDRFFSQASEREIEPFAVLDEEDAPDIETEAPYFAEQRSWDDESIDSSIDATTDEYRLRELALADEAVGYAEPYSREFGPDDELIEPTASRAPQDGDAQSGDFADMPALRVLYDLAVTRATGALDAIRGDLEVRAHFREGLPLKVTTSADDQRLGALLIEREIITDAELAMALAVKERLDCGLVETLVELGVLEPHAASAALRDALRTRLLDLCSWPAGSFWWHPDVAYEGPSDGVLIDPFELLGAGAMAIDDAMVEAWSQPRLELIPRALANARVDLDAFALGSRPREIHRLLDGDRTLRDFRSLFPSQRIWLDALRVLYLFEQVELCTLERARRRPRVGVAGRR